MRTIVLILLFAITGCTEPLAPTSAVCVHYRIGNAEHTSTVQFVDGWVVCDNWRLSITSTPNNQTRLFRDTTMQGELGTVYQSSEFLFNNAQVSDTIRGVYVSHSKGSVCDTYDTLPVWAVRVPCSTNPNGDL